MVAKKTTHDDLTKISGIGDARQQWLGETFGVRTYADLAALYADDIETQLKVEGKPYSRIEIELWPQEAAELAAETSPLSIRTTVNSPASEVGNSPAKEIHAEEAIAPKAEDGQWKPVATFIVEFQTRQAKDQGIELRTKVNYHDTDQEVVYPGIESDRICRWMVEQAGSELQGRAREVLVAEPEGKATEAPLSERLSVASTDLRLYQPAGTEVSLTPRKNGRPYAGSIRAGASFAVEAGFELSEQSTAVIGKREIPYRVQFYTHNRATGEKVHLGEAEPSVLSATRASYSALLAGITLPAGAFRLQVVVLTDSEHVAPIYLELPMLRAQ